MNDICRLCLCCCSNTRLKSLGDIEVQLSDWFHVEINSDVNLPSRVCPDCVDKVNEMFQFLETVKKNQFKLEYFLRLNQLQYFYLNLKVLNEEIKTSQDESFPEVQNNANITENDVEIKSDIMDHKNNVNYSSDDSLSLLSIKTIQKSNNQNHKTNKKKIKQKSNPKAKENNPTANGSVKDNLLNTEKYHKCLTCFQLFVSRKILLNHYNKKHKSVTKTDHNTDNFITLDGNKFKCSKCMKVFQHKKHVKSHLNSTHSDHRPFLCNLCGRTFKVVTQIILHARAHGDGARFSCNFKCGYSTTYINNLKDHEKRHKQEYKYKCEKCGKGFLVRTWFEEHQNIHTGFRPFICDLCGSSFHLKRYLTKHRNTIHAHPQSTGLQRFVCIHCSLPCDNKNALKEHLSNEHGIKTYFLCDFCGKQFSTAGQLKTHKAFHLERKNFGCSTCRKSFTTKYHLKRHQSTHSVVKNHACNKCKKSYKQQSALMRHRLKHHSTLCSKTE